MASLDRTGEARITVPGMRRPQMTRQVDFQRAEEAASKKATIDRMLRNGRIRIHRNPTA